MTPGDYKYVYKNGHRCYLIGDKYYPSVTSITHQISNFKNSKPGNSAKIGTLVHHHILKNYSKRCLKLPTETIWGLSSEIVNSRITSAINMWRELNFKFKFDDVECLVVNDVGYAGRVDFIGWDENNEYSVCDIKTGGIYQPEYNMQLAAYCKAVKSNKGYFIQLDLNEERNPDRKGKVITLNQTEIDKYFEDFLECLEEFNNEHLRR